MSVVVPTFGWRFIKDAKAKGRPIFVWTVNEESMMRWSISKGLDGVITDDPKKFLEVCDDWERGKRDIKFTRRQWVSIVWINLMILIFGGIFYWRYGAEDKRKKASLTNNEKPRKGLKAATSGGQRQ